MNASVGGLFNQKMHWKEYNRELAARGSLTVWLGDNVASKWASNVRLLGSATWKRAQRYRRRSLAEAAMHRLKAAFGSGLRSIGRACAGCG